MSENNGVILIVDDETGTRVRINQIIEKLDYMSVEADRGSNGIEMLRDYKVDVIICDDHMAEMNGVEFLRQVRNLGYRMPFIYMTDDANSETAIDALRLGAFDIQSKEDMDKPGFRTVLYDAVSLSKLEQDFNENIERIIPVTDDPNKETEWQEAAWYVMSLKALNANS